MHNNSARNEHSNSVLFFVNRKFRARIYRDEDQHEEVGRGEKLYKDLITYFVLKEVKLRSNLQSVDVVVETQEDKNASNRKSERQITLRIKAGISGSKSLIRKNFKSPMETPSFFA